SRRLPCRWSRGWWRCQVREWVPGPAFGLLRRRDRKTQWRRGRRLGRALARGPRPLEDQFGLRSQLEGRQIEPDLDFGRACRGLDLRLTAGRCRRRFDVNVFEVSPVLLDA